MSVDTMATEPLGDKKNSDFFNEYRLKIYERRKSSGIITGTSSTDVDPTRS